jgi:hypothetical protein
MSTMSTIYSMMNYDEIYDVCVWKRGCELRRRRCPIFGTILIQSGAWRLVEACTSSPMQQRGSNRLHVLMVFLASVAQMMYIDVYIDYIQYTYTIIYIYIHIYIYYNYFSIGLYRSVSMWIGLADHSMPSMPHFSHHVVWHVVRRCRKERYAWCPSLPPPPPPSMLGQRRLRNLDHSELTVRNWMSHRVSTSNLYIISYIFIIHLHTFNVLLTQFIEFYWQHVTVQKTVKL